MHFFECSCRGEKRKRKPDSQDFVVTGERIRKAFQSEGLEKINEITYIDDRNGVRVVGFKASSMH